jgi:acetyl esterase
MRTIMKITHEPLGSLPPDAVEVFAAMGPVWGTDINKHRDFVIATYTPLVAAANNEGITVHRDIAYGESPRQTLDVFAPAPPRQGGAASGADVVIFVHGGAFVRGKKSFNGHIYDNVSYWFARQGYLCINLEYRLADEAPYPGGADDVAAAVDWARANIESFGGAPHRVFLIGHSAGGTHVATCLFDPAFDRKPDPAVAGIVLISARLRADVLPDNPNATGVRTYFGDDTSLYEARSPVTHAHRSQVPLMIAVAEFENPYLDLYGAEFLYRAAAARKSMPRFIQLMKHNHTSIVAHFNSGEELLGREIINFFAGIPAATPETGK